MRTSFSVPLAMALVIGAATLILVLGPVAAEPVQAGHDLTKADIDRWMTELANWGRWRKADQAGTVNLITPYKRKAAAQLYVRASLYRWRGRPIK